MVISATARPALSVAYYLGGVRATELIDGECPDLVDHHRTTWRGRAAWYDLQL
jgi:hypothetical protein